MRGRHADHDNRAEPLGAALLRTPPAGRSRSSAGRALAGGDVVEAAPDPYAAGRWSLRAGSKVGAVTITAPDVDEPFTVRVTPKVPVVRLLLPARPQSQPRERVARRGGGCGRTPGSAARSRPCRRAAGRPDPAARAAPGVSDGRGERPGRPRANPGGRADPAAVRCDAAGGSGVRRIHTDISKNRILRTAVE
ncbi:McrBC 5-methylcytosine restriction system component [Streptomyces sp. F-3]|nr:McrBC 5-methylcytosine restriction system component [Streptomyces sp. F-3]